MKVVDCRGLACPQPVMETKKVLDNMKSGYIEVIVDNVAAKENVSRFAKGQGCQVEITEKGRDFYLKIMKVNQNQEVQTGKNFEFK